MIDAVHMLLYGQSATGKTTFWATFPGPIRVMICSGGNKPGELRSVNTPEYRKKIFPVMVNSYDDFERELRGCKEGGYETAVLDHASGFSDLLIKELLGLDEIPVTKSKRAGKGESWSLVSQQQYGQLAVQLKEAFRNFLSLPCNVVIVSQERVFGGKEDGGDPDLIRPTVGAALIPSVVGWLNPACDYVVQTYKRPKMEDVVSSIGGKDIVTRQRGRGVEYCLRTEPHDVFMTKFRVPKGTPLPECIVDPTYDKMIALINGNG